jgi:hypothetical protein
MGRRSGDGKRGLCTHVHVHVRVYTRARARAEETKGSIER